MLHHVESRAEYVKTLAGYLSSRGRIAVVDYEGGKGPHATQPDLAGHARAARGLDEGRGLTQVDDVKLFPDKYVLTFARR